MNGERKPETGKNCILYTHIQTHINTPFIYNCQLISSDTLAWQTCEKRLLKKSIISLLSLTLTHNSTLSVVGVEDYTPPHIRWSSRGALPCIVTTVAIPSPGIKKNPTKSTNNVIIIQARTSEKRPVFAFIVVPEMTKSFRISALNGHRLNTQFVSKFNKWWRHRSWFCVAVYLVVPRPKYAHQPCRSTKMAYIHVQYRRIDRTA